MASDKMGVVGERDAVLAFKAMGMRVETAQTQHEVHRAVMKLAG